MSVFASRNGSLHVEDVPLTDIADEYGTPTFVYSKRAIIEAYTEFHQAFERHPHLICYAVKANSNLAVLNILAGLGAGFDIVSGGELQRVLAAGGDPEKIVFSGVGKQHWELSLALKTGISCFNLESAEELHLLNQIAAQLGVTAAVSVRVNPNVDAQTHPYISTGLRENKFGVSDSQALQIYRQAHEMAHIAIKGIDFHIGSQITELSPFADALARILDLVDQLEKEDITLAHIDVGGGLGIRYQDEAPIDVQEYASCVLQTLGNRRQKLIFEPGRMLVGNAGLLLTQVLVTKHNGEKRFVVVDAAMNDLIRPALYQAWQKIVNVADGGNPSLCDVVGPVCETGDFLAKDRNLDASAGDLLAIHSSGAYGFVMSSNYNSRNRACEVMVAGDQSFCVRQRESFEDQVRLETILPNHLQ